MQDNEPLMRALSSLINLNHPDLVLFVGEALVRSCLRLHYSGAYSVPEYMGTGHDNFEALSELADVIFSLLWILHTVVWQRGLSESFTVQTAIEHQIEKPATSIAIFNCIKSGKTLASKTIQIRLASCSLINIWRTFDILPDGIPILPKHCIWPLDCFASSAHCMRPQSALAAACVRLLARVPINATEQTAS